MLTKQLIEILSKLSNEDKEKPVKIWDSKSDTYVDVSNVAVIFKNKFGERCILID